MTAPISCPIDLATEQRVHTLAMATNKAATLMTGLAGP